MKRIYMMSYDPFETNGNLLFRYLEGSDQVLNWRYPSMPGTVFIASQLNVPSIQALLQNHMNGLKFYIAEVSVHSIAGWAENSTWDFLRDPPEIAPPVDSLSPAVLEAIDDMMKQK